MYCYLLSRFKTQNIGKVFWKLKKTQDHSSLTILNNSVYCLFKFKQTCSLLTLSQHLGQMEEKSKCYDDLDLDQKVPFVCFQSVYSN